jgi:hypothetical protein
MRETVAKVALILGMLFFVLVFGMYVWGQFGRLFR